MLNKNMLNNTPDTIIKMIAVRIGFSLIQEELNELKDFLVHSIVTYPLISGFILSVALNGYFIWKACKTKRKKMFPHSKTAA